MSADRSILVTGATGLLGRDVLARLLAADATLRAFVLVRDVDRWRRSLRELGNQVVSSRCTATSAPTGSAWSLTRAPRFAAT